MIRPIESGTIHIKRALAACIWANSPDHSIRYPCSFPFPRPAPVFGSFDFLLGLVDRRGEVAVADAELDRDVALVVLAIDVRRAWDVRD